MKEYKNASWNIKRTPNGDEIDKNIQVEINGELSFVPISESNTDYAEILKQVKEGTLTIKDAD